MYKNYFKSLLDFFIALIILILVIPIAVVTAIILFCVVGNPIFFRQIRLGKNGKEFGIIKFRTMKTKTDVNQTDAQRLTKIGAFLRKTSIDEIPQLINILKGDMSFIGPRPLLPEYYEYFREDEKKRFEVKPGMSGYAEIKGRHQLTWDKQFAYDVEYVENLSFLFDMKIFLKTIPKVLNSSKVTGMGNAGKSRLDQVRQKQN